VGWGAARGVSSFSYIKPADEGLKENDKEEGAEGISLEDTSGDRNGGCVSSRNGEVRGRVCVESSDGVYDICRYS
jgi:hypothetical protein